MDKIKIKYNVTFIKWSLTIFFLLGNLMLFALDRSYDYNDSFFLIVYEIIINSLAIFSFIMLSIFPRFYYFIDNDGVSFQNRKREISYISWKNIKRLYYAYVFGFIPQGIIFEFNENYHNKMTGMGISRKQARMLYENVPNIKLLMDQKI